MRAKVGFFFPDVLIGLGPWQLERARQGLALLGLLLVPFYLNIDVIRTQVTAQDAAPNQARHPITWHT